MPPIKQASTRNSQPGASGVTSLRTESVCLLNELRRRYIGSPEFAAILEPAGIAILGDFLDNWNNVERFYVTYYGDSFPRTVLCGINPGRLGAGKTGVPFVDFSSLSQLLGGVERYDTERSAQFFWNIVSYFGPERFFRSFYVTNLSWVGYIQGRTNRNYYDLPKEAIEFISRMYKYEMAVTDPERVIALSKKVQDTAHGLLDNRMDISIRLPHPNFCAFPRNYRQCRAEYIETLSKFMRK